MLVRDDILPEIIKTSLFTFSLFLKNIEIFSLIRIFYLLVNK